ncbi:MAG: undecaprenyl-diphosphate phosphatase [Solirubrobacterales bacterium]
MNAQRGASGDGTLRASEAVILGIVQGPTELLPVSSSAHLRLIPWLLGWEHERVDPEHRKAFEVAVHGGAALALMVGQRRLIAEELRQIDGRRLAVIALSFVPPAFAGLTFERQIEGRLGGPGATAAGLALGAVAMLASDRMPQSRGQGEANAADGLALGVAQAAALVPGVSRNGATLIAARRRGFNREQANLLSRTVALPVIAGAAMLKGERLRRRGVDRSLRRSLTIGTLTAFVSTLASQRLLRLVEKDRALWPYALYRLGLAGVVLRRHFRLNQVYD